MTATHPSPERLSSVLLAHQDKLVTINTLQELDRDSVKVVDRCRRIIEYIQKNNCQKLKDHQFFMIAQQSLNHFAILANRFDFDDDEAVEISVCRFRRVLGKFLTWRQDICDLLRNTRECSRELVDFREKEYPSASNISHVLKRTEKIANKICNLAVPLQDYLDFVVHAISCIDHVKSQTVFLEYCSYHPYEIEDLSDALSRLRTFFSSSEFAEEAEDHFSMFFNQDEEHMHQSEIFDREHNDHDVAANRRRSHLQHGLLVSWLDSHDHRDLYLQFLDHVETMVEAEQHPAGNVSFP